MRLTEEQAEDRLGAAFRPALFDALSQSEQQAFREWVAAGDDFSAPRFHPVALRAVGVRWVEDHYEEVGE